jgi:peptidoglycan hydrolase-like protein with peptidoglycan-binding domain
MRILIAVLLLASVAQLRADGTIANAQQELKDQGFYYGQITGEKNADTSAAIRRFQIRNGLQVTGELNDETLQSLRSAATSSPLPVQPAPPAATPAPRVDSDTSDLRDQTTPPERARAYASPVQPFVAPPVAPPPTVYQGKVIPPETGIFAETPYETAPPEVQRKIIITAQRVLAHQGLFKGPVDGAYGSEMEFSLRAYQSRVGLAPTGRLDLETLAALGLLPGARMPVFAPRRIVPSAEPPVRGEWIRP